MLRLWNGKVCTFYHLGKISVPKTWKSLGVPEDLLLQTSHPATHRGQCGRGWNWCIHACFFLLVRLPNPCSERLDMAETLLPQGKPSCSMASQTHHPLLSCQHMNCTFYLFPYEQQFVSCSLKTFLRSLMFLSVVFTKPLLYTSLGESVLLLGKWETRAS